MANLIIEQNCVFMHEGKAFEAGGAVIADDLLIAYVGENGVLNDWHGNVIGAIKLTRSWKTPRSYVSDRMYQAYATVNGKTYTGRTAGVSMRFKGKPVKA